METTGDWVTEPQPLLEILKEEDGLILLGDPGSGKSTFLRYLTLLLARGESKKLGWGGHFPIYLPLAEYAEVLAQKDVALDGGG